MADEDIAVGSVQGAKNVENAINAGHERYKEMKASLVSHYLAMVIPGWATPVLDAFLSGVRAGEIPAGDIVVNGKTWPASMEVVRDAREAATRFSDEIDEACKEESLHEVGLA